MNTTSELIDAEIGLVEIGLVRLLRKVVRGIEKQTSRPSWTEDTAKWLDHVISQFSDTVVILPIDLTNPEERATFESYETSMIEIYRRLERQKGNMFRGLQRNQIAAERGQLSQVMELLEIFSAQYGPRTERVAALSKDITLFRAIYYRMYKESEAMEGPATSTVIDTDVADSEDIRENMPLLYGDDEEQLRQALEEVQIGVDDGGNQEVDIEMAEG